MGLLGDFLETFYGSGQTFRSVRAKVRRECKSTTKGKTSRRQPIGKEKSPSTASNSVTGDSDFWAVLPDRVRIDATEPKTEKLKPPLKLQGAASV